MRVLGTKSQLGSLSTEHFVPDFFKTLAKWAEMATLAKRPFFQCFEKIGRFFASGLGP